MGHRTRDFRREAITEKSKSNRDAALPPVNGSVTVGAMLGVAFDNFPDKAIWVGRFTEAVISRRPSCSFCKPNWLV